MTTSFDRTGPTTVAGVYSYMVGGESYTAADVAAAKAMLEREPGIQQSFVENLQHNVLRVRDLISRGYRRFLDIGAGELIDTRNTPAVARASGEPVRVVCVDYDDTAVRGGQSVLAGDDNAHYLRGDLRDVDQILAAPPVAELLAGGEPVAVLLFTVVHYVRDSDDPAGVLRRLRSAVPPGSVLVLSHAMPLERPQDRQDVVDAGFAAANPLVLRDPEEILALVRTWGTPEPGVFVGEWGVAEQAATNAAQWVFTTSATRKS
jgi:SAM-dependent methyltransferase